MINGIMIGIIELVIFGCISHKIRKSYKQLQIIHPICYYWFMFTILTMIWEFSFIIQYEDVILLSDSFITNKEHVWTNDYNLSYILPWKLSTIFYAEYGAYADKQYMISYNVWSRIIEGSHAILCGFTSLLGIYTKITMNDILYLIFVSISMGSQCMNSFLYLSNYVIQLNESYNNNYISEEFPAGYLLSKRPFMYVNFFWMFMPMLIMIHLLFENKSKHIYIDFINI